MDACLCRHDKVRCIYLTEHLVAAQEDIVILLSTNAEGISERDAPSDPGIKNLFVQLKILERIYANLAHQAC